MPLGYLCLVLHAHLPYVRHPEYDDFLEEDWFYEAITETYIPILEVMDSLERDGIGNLEREAERLQKSCRRLIWLNPLLRFAAFEPRAAGVRALLPKVDSFRPIHNLRSMDDLVAALGHAATPRDATFPARDPMRRA